MISTKSGALGFHEPLSTLSEQFQNSVVLEKIQALHSAYYGYRRSRGDGNCYFRSVGFGFLEQDFPTGVHRFLRLLRARKDSLVPAKKIRVEHVGVFESREKLCPLLEEWSIGGVDQLRDMYLQFLTHADVDIALVWCVRGLLAEFCLHPKNADFLINGDFPMGSLIQDVLGYPSLLAFVNSEVLVEGEEARDAVQLLMPYALRCKVRLVQIDGQRTPDGRGIVMHFPSTDEGFVFPEDEEDHSHSSGEEMEHSGMEVNHILNPPAVATPDGGIGVTASCRRSALSLGSSSSSQQEAGSSSPKVGSKSGCMGSFTKRKLTGSGLGGGFAAKPSGGSSEAGEGGGEKSRTSSTAHSGSSARNPSGSSSTLEVCLLFKPGHYDILYQTAFGKAVEEQEAAWGLIKQCRLPWQCLLCLCDEDEGRAQVVRNWCCDHCLCTECKASLSGREECCPECQALPK